MEQGPTFIEKVNQVFEKQPEVSRLLMEHKLNTPEAIKGLDDPLARLIEVFGSDEAISDYSITYAEAVLKLISLG